jgi:hypothetical protein
MKIRRAGRDTFLLIKGKRGMGTQKSLYPQYGSVYIFILQPNVENTEASDALTFLLVIGKTPEQVMRVAEMLPNNGEGKWIL